jgi:hypothetical protein
MTNLSDDYPIVKCSHCNQITSSENFNNHKCDWLLKGTKRIYVTNFLDVSYENKKLISGWGTDGILYTFEVVPRKPIPIIIPLADGFSQRKRTDDNFTESLCLSFLQFSIHRMHKCFNRSNPRFSAF